MKVGRSIWIDGHKRTVTKVFPNNDGNDVLRWESKKEQGVCTISLWKEWATHGYNEGRRR